LANLRFAGSERLGDEHAFEHARKRSLPSELTHYLDFFERFLNFGQDFRMFVGVVSGKKGERTSERAPGVLGIFFLLLMLGETSDEGDVSAYDRGKKSFMTLSLSLRRAEETT